MQNLTRQRFNDYIQQIAQLNGVSVEAVIQKFAVDPSVQQRLEKKIQESSAFLKSINMQLVDEQEGEALGLMVASPIASTQDTDAGDRQTSDPSSLESDKYRCEQTNYDTHLTYKKLDAWAKFPNFQQLIRDQIIQRIALDRIMIGFNGTRRAATSNKTTSPLLQDVNLGWLQKIRSNAPNRWVKDGAIAGKITVGASGDFETIDALVYDAVHSFLDPWYREDTQIVAITGGGLLLDKYFPLLNQQQPPSEQIAAMDLITSQKRLGSKQAVNAPFMLEKAILITRLDNLSVYVQSGTQRRSVVENAKRDRIETYQSSNDAYVIEDYGCCALIENIEII